MSPPIRLTLSLSSPADAHSRPNAWISHFTSTENRHALPLFTSLLNTVCAFDPVGYGVPYNHLMFADASEPLVEIALQLLCVTVDSEPGAGAAGTAGGGAAGGGSGAGGAEDGGPPDRQAFEHPEVCTYSPTVSVMANIFIFSYFRLELTRDRLRSFVRLFNFGRYGRQCATVAFLHCVLYRWLYSLWKSVM